jgi:hypothetical protein
MAAKICAFLALLALSVSAATAVTMPQCSVAAAVATIPQLLSPYAIVGYEHPIVQSYRLQQALAASIAPSSAMVNSAAYLQQQQLVTRNQLVAVNPAAILLQQPNPLDVANPTAFWQQQQQLVNQMAVVNRAAILQQQLNQLVVANPATFWQQQQQLVNQLAAVNPTAILQQQQLNPLVVANPTAFWQQLVNQQALTSPAASFQQAIVGSALF